MIVEMHGHTSEHSSCSHVAAADLGKHTGLPDGFQSPAGQEVDAGGFGHVLIYGVKAAISKPTSNLRRIWTRTSWLR